MSTFETFADKLVSFPCIRQGSKYPSELLPSVDAFVLIAGTCDLIPSKVISQPWLGYIIKDTILAHWRETPLLVLKK